MITRSGRYPSTDWAERRLYRPFLLAALAIGLTVGFTLGAAMLAATAHGRGVPAGAIQLHGTAQLFGWAGLTVMGIAYHVVPRFRGSPPMPHPRPQQATLALVAGALLLRLVAYALAPETTSGARSPAAGVVALASGALLLAGAGVFAAVIGGVLRRGRPSPVPVEPWIWAGLTWLLIAAVAHLGGVASMAWRGEALLPQGWNEAMTRAAMFGFAGGFIVAVSFRAVAGFLALRPRRGRVGGIAFALVQTGIALGVIGSLGASTTAALGDLALGAGLLAVVAALRIFEPRTGARERRPGTYPRHEWFVVAAYGWLALAAVLLLLEASESLGLAPTTIDAPVLHLVALGFVTMMIAGFGSRALPLFEGRAITRHRALDVCFVALNASAATRLLFTSAVPSAPGLAVSGFLGLLALGCFAVALWRLLAPGASAVMPAGVDGASEARQA